MTKPLDHRKALGCGLALLLLAIVVIVVLDSERSTQVQLELTREKRRSEFFTEVKAGQNYVSVDDTELVRRLANDTECIKNLHTINFSMTDLGDQSFQSVKKLVNVREIVIYDCRNTDRFLQSIAGMPSVESIYFESIDINDDLLQQLKSFPNLKKVEFIQTLNQHQIATLKAAAPNAEIIFSDTP